MTTFLTEALENQHLGFFSFKMKNVWICRVFAKKETSLYWSFPDDDDDQDD